VFPKAGHGYELGGTRVTLSKRGKKQHAEARGRDLLKVTDNSGAKTLWKE